MVEQYEQWKASGALAPQKRERWGGLALCLMQWGLLFDIAMFPLGMSLREIGAIWSVACLLAFYLLAWDRSVLRVLPFKWLYLGFMSFILFKIAHSEFPLVSWEGVHHNFYKGFAMLLVGLEYPRRERDVKRLVWAFVIAVLILGLDGVYQAVAGVDLIEGTPLQGGRLTGSFSTPRAGNYMSFVLPVTLCLFLALPQRLGHRKRAVITLGIFALEFFFLAGTETRSALMGSTVALVVVGLAYRQARIGIAAAILLVVGAFFVAPERFALSQVMNDLRFVEIWPQAIELFKAYPVLGAGMNTFSKAFALTGVAAGPERLGWAHPHNIYLQFLCEGGVVGLAVLLGFLFGSLAMAWRMLRCGEGDRSRLDWLVAYTLFASFCGYMATALSAHNFFRTWWLGIALTGLGLCLGVSHYVWNRGRQSGALPEDER